MATKNNRKKDLPQMNATTMKKTCLKCAGLGLVNRVHADYGQTQHSYAICDLCAGEGYAVADPAVLSWSEATALLVEKLGISRENAFEMLAFTDSLDFRTVERVDTGSGPANLFPRRELLEIICIAK